MSFAAYDTDRPDNERKAGTGWDMITNPIMMMFMGLKDVSRPDYATTVFDFGGQPNVPGVYDSMGNFYPREGPGRAGYSFSGGAGGGTGSGASGAGGGATWATPELAPIAQGTNTAGLGLSPEALGLSGAGASGSISGAGGAGLTKYVNAALQGYSALQGSKQRQQGQQGGETTRTPYQAHMLNPFIPLILSEALNIFKKRQATSGRQASNFEPLLAMLGQYMNK